MTSVLSIERISYADYLLAEEKSLEKHEYICGEILAMSGGTPEHGALAAALIVRISMLLDGRPCRPFTSDVRVRVLETDFAAYPDVSVVCGHLETAPDDPNAITNPIVLIEVLSDSTEAYDRGAKAAHYRQIPSLREYVLVSQHEPLVEVYRRNEHGRWELYEYRAGDRIELASLRVNIEVDAVYANPLAEEGKSPI